METVGATGLLNCKLMAADIKMCQGLGKKVLLGMSGAKELSNTTIPNKLKTKTLAMQLWDLFGAGIGIDPVFRPFGKVIVDGFDISNSVLLCINFSNPNQHTFDNEDNSTRNHNTFVSFAAPNHEHRYLKKILHVRCTSVSHSGQINPSGKYASHGFRFCVEV